MAANTLNFPFEKLRGRENFDVWKRHAKSYLVLKNCWKVTEAGVLEQKDSIIDERALAEITLMVEPCNFAHIASAATAKEAWDSLMAAYEDSGLTRKVDLLRKLVQLKLEHFPSMQEYVNEMVMTSIKVKGAGLNIEDEVIASLMLAGLPNEYQALVMAIENSKSKLTVDNVKSLLLQDTKFDNKSEYVGKALYAKNFKQKQNNSNKKRFRCYGCGQEGHMRKECTKNSKKAIEDIKQKKSTTTSNSLMVSACLHTYSQNVWYIDSGATSHMTNDRRLIVDEKPSQNKNVILANKESIPIESVGDVKLIMNKNNKKQITNVQNVEFVPNLCANLLSVRQMTMKGKKVVFKGDNCKIYDEAGKIVATAYVENNLYRLDCKSEPISKAMSAIDNFLLWHRRLGHICNKSLNSVKNYCSDVNYSNLNDAKCVVCAKGKQTRTTCRESGTRANNLLDLVHSDVLGPISTPLFSGARYLLIFVDDFSRKVFALPMIRKSDIFDKFKDFKILVENQCGRKIKILRTDNGTEYCNDQFLNFVKTCGILHQKTAPYTPEQNGVAERINRTIIERVRCMLFDSGLDNIFWAEAANTAAYLINRVPCRGNNKSPEEIWTGVKPNLKHLHVFGCNGAHTKAKKNQT